MTYINPLTAINHDREPYGDPFVFRHKGQYYLFVSTPDGATNIRVFISTDLVNWEYFGDAVDEPILEAAYAPEIIYCYNRFYMITSPKGLGHFIYVAEQPGGPYKRLTNNVESMIDGSFFVGPDAKLHLLRADHAGIALLDVSPEGRLSNRRNLGTYLSAWTEGPSVFYRDGYYYLTYCGNHLLSKGYRIAYASSKYFDRDYKEGLNNPLLINTNEGYTRLGHNSSVLGPDLDGWYIVYHTVIEKDKQFLPRKFMVDRLQFSGRLMHVASTSFAVPSPKRPLYETYDPQREMKQQGEFLLSPFATEARFTLEATFKGVGVSLIVDYRSENRYIELQFNKDNIMLITHQSRSRIATMIKCPFDFNFEHTLRLINDEHCELLIDNVPLAKFNKLGKGQIGYKGKGQYFYTAFTNHANGSSDGEYPNIIPGLLDVSHRQGTTKSFIDPLDEIATVSLIKDQYTYIAAKNARYALFIYANLKEEVTLAINDQVVTLKPTASEYNYISYFAGLFDLKKEGVLTLYIIKGTIDYKFITVDMIPGYKQKLDFIKEGNILLPHNDKDSFLLEKDVDAQFDVNVDFKINTIRPFDVFGILLATRQFSNEFPQARYPLIGYLVGFEGGLLIIDALNYGRHRIYDRPTAIKENVNYNLRTSFKNGLFKVYLNHELLITTTVSQPAYLGSHGLFASAGTKVELSYPSTNLRKEADENHES